MVIPLLLLGCGAKPTPSTPVEEAHTVPALDPVALLSRASLDLRGVRPTVAEIQAVEADAGALDGMLDDFLQDARFGERVVDLYSELYLTRTESFLVNTAMVETDDTAAFVTSLGEEPLRLLAHVATEDLPWTEIVLGDYTLVDERLAAAFPTDYPAGGQGWQVARYTDDRPAAGVLSTNGLWWRYVSTDSNANRKRANTATRLLLCEDYLTRPIEFDRNVNLLEEDEVNDALQNSAGCVNCHSSLDPLAAHFFGFYWYNYQSPAEAISYHPERERLWASFTGVGPGYFGQPSYSLEDLGRNIAADPRFPTCAVEQAWSLLLRRDPQVTDLDHLTAHREAFLEGGLTLRALFRSILEDELYRAGPPATGEDLATGAVSLKMATPDLLASEVEDLTGFRWTYQGADMMRTDSVGLRTLAGGADGATVTKTSRAPSATLALVQEALAEAASGYVVQADAALPASERRLFTQVDFSETPDTGRDAMVAQLQDLHLRIFGQRVEADGEQVAAGLELWSALYAVEGSATLAWQGVLSALLRDPDFLLY